MRPTPLLSIGLALVPCLYGCGTGDLVKGPYVVINEVVARAVDGPDWVELYNGGTKDANLEGWTINGDGLPKELASDEFIQVHMSQLGSSDEVTLINEEGHVVDETDWLEGEAAEGRSWGRLPDGVGPFSTLSRPSPGKPNHGTIAQSVCGDGIVEGIEVCDGTEFVDSCKSLGYESGGLRCVDCVEISPIACLPHPSDVVLNEVFSDEEGFEVFNSGEESVDLSGWTVVDRHAQADARAHALSGFVQSGAVAVDYISTFNLDRDEHLTLRDPAGRVMDFIEWRGGATSKCRWPDGGEWMSSDCPPTPGAHNDA